MTDTYQAIYDAVRSRLSNGDIGTAVAEAVNQQMAGLSWAIEGIKQEYVTAAFSQQNTAEEARRPSVLYRPAISLDGNQWCALYGDNLQDGVAGFGESPDAAMRDFDRAWITTQGANHDN